VKGVGLLTLLISASITAALLFPLRAGTLSVGLFVGTAAAAFDIVQLLSWELPFIAGELAENREYLRDLTAFANLSEQEGAKDAPASIAAKPECIEFKNVSFKYPGTKKMILQDFNLTLRSEKLYAIAGVNGAGKTTLINLLTGLYDNYCGEILIDGRNLRSFRQTELKAMFSVVYQDYAKYQIPLRDCIGLGGTFRASEAEIIEAVSMLGLADTVNRMPDRLDTPLGKVTSGASEASGADLSGGEWQRVAVARTLVSPAPVRVLDEPAASLDPAAESGLYQLFAGISRQKFTLLITHRLGAARIADEIILIDEGRVAERGSHDELVQAGGIYAAMFESQGGWYK
jgi:ATP-binding cassette subfamily B protein